MKKQIMASVLLASMMFSVSGYADYELTPDENDSYNQYKSPLEQSYGPIVNDRPKAESADDGEAFARVAGQLTQRTVSNIDISSQKAGRKELPAATETVTVPAIETDKRKESEKDEVVAAKKVALDKADRRAEEVLSETDDNFEPARDKVYPGYEYQARRQIKSYSDPEILNNDLQKDNNAAFKPAELKSAEAPGLSASDGDAEKTENKVSLAGNGGNPVSPDSTGKKPQGKKDAKKMPLIIRGNDARYSSESGDFIIEGNVTLEQGVTKMFSSKAVGNEKTGDIWLLEGGTIAEPTNKVYSRWAHYNYNRETGELFHIKGAARPDVNSNKFDYYEAPHGIIENGMMIIDQGGMTTRCPAVKHHPCLSVKAKTITIIPNDRIIARKVHVFVKGKHVYSRDVWINDLQKKSNQITPHVGWDDERGWHASLEYSRPIGNPLLKNRTVFSMEQTYYSKSRYKPFYSIRHDQRDFYVRANSGYIYDSDDDRLDEGVWLQKKIDWGLFLKPHRIAKGLPLSIDGYITHGLWKYSHRDWESWHTEKAVYLRHDRFYPFGGQKLYADLMVGRKWTNESLDNRTTRRYGKNLNTNIYHGTVGYRFSDKWNIWTSYHKEKKTSYLFSKGQPSFSKDWRAGIGWSPDKHNTFTIVNCRNLDSETRTHGNYTTTFSWFHRFCCEVLTVSYQKKHYNDENKWTVKFEFLNW
jgi:hypothetical protein